MHHTSLINSDKLHYNRFSTNCMYIIDLNRVIEWLSIGWHNMHHMNMHVHNVISNGIFMEDNHWTSIGYTCAYWDSWPTVWAIDIFLLIAMCFQRFGTHSWCRCKVGNDVNDAIEYSSFPIGWLIVLKI